MNYWLEIWSMNTRTFINVEQNVCDEISILLLSTICYQLATTEADVPLSGAGIRVSTARITTDSINEPMLHQTHTTVTWLRATLNTSITSGQRRSGRGNSDKNPPAADCHRQIFQFQHDTPRPDETLLIFFFNASVNSICQSDIYRSRSVLGKRQARGKILFKCY